MNPADDFLHRAETLYSQAKRIPASQRVAFIRKHAAGDETLCREVDALLRAEADMNQGFLNAPVIDYLRQGIDPCVRRVGPWAIEDLIGIGGMGAVFRGRRADGAFDAEVAIKFIRDSVIDPVLRDRFLRERQILATLDHPNIARLLDGGVTEHGQPYLVMELVKGASLIEYCDNCRAPIDVRLQLFEQACQAVQHAHGHLIVHRDLKPSNILVDPTGRPRLLDFGVSSILSDTEPPGTITRTQQRRFTPQYAAPEQVRGEPTTVVTDVYALGVILYELLSGARPYEVTTGFAPADAQLICETEPPPPSRRIDGSDSDIEVSTIAQLRSTDVLSLHRKLKGDLDDIAMMALRKEPQRRYGTVEALRADLDRYRRGLPVTARPDTLRYRARKFIRRHRTPVALAASLCIVLIAATTISSTLAIRLHEQRQELSEALVDRQHALDEAVEQQAAARRESRRALSSSSVLIQTLAALAAHDEASRERVTAYLRDRVKRLDTVTLPINRDAEIAVRQSLAMLARTVEAFDIALEQNERVLALAGDLPEEADSREQAIGQIGWLHLQNGKPERAITALLTLREMVRERRGTQHLTQVDAQLVEALLMVGQFEAARGVVGESELPPPPVGAFLEERIRELESQFGVSLLPENGI